MSKIAWGALAEDNDVNSTMSVNKMVPVRRKSWSSWCTMCKERERENGIQANGIQAHGIQANGI